MVPRIGHKDWWQVFGFKDGFQRLVELVSRIGLKIGSNDWFRRLVSRFGFRIGFRDWFQGLVLGTGFRD